MEKTMKNYFYYDEIKDYFDDFLRENLEYFKENWPQSWRDDLHYKAFNTDYYITGSYQAKQWLGDKAFDAIKIVKDYEQDNFGKVSTDLTDAERVVNMYVYIVGLDIVAEWLEANPETEEVA